MLFVGKILDTCNFIQQCIDNRTLLCLSNKSNTLKYLYLIYLNSNIPEIEGAVFRTNFPIPQKV